MNINIKRVKLIVKTPKENVDEIRQVLGDAGSGITGDYTHCSVAIDFIGTFKRKDKTDIVVTDGVKIEVVCEMDKAKSVIQKVKEVHPYEEPVIDIIPLIEETDLC